MKKIVVILAFITLIALGTWQVERLKWKEGLLQQRALAEKSPPIPLSLALDKTNPIFTTVSLAGHFVTDKQFIIAPKTVNGRAVFFRAVPFISDEKQVIVVILGYEDWRKSSSPLPLPKTRVILNGVLYPSQKPARFTPVNIPEKGVWHSIYTEEIASFYGLKPSLPFYVQLTTPILNLPTLPPYPTLTNNHLQYAITWYSFAVILLVIVGIKRLR